MKKWFLLWSDILSYIIQNKNSCRSLSTLSMNTNITYSHTVKTINTLVEYGLVEVIKHTKTNEIIPTEKGIRVGGYILKIKGELSK